MRLLYTYSGRPTNWLILSNKKKWILKNFTGKNCKNEHIAERIVKSYRCPKIGGDAKQTLEIRVERKRNLKLGELDEVNFGI